MKFRYLLILFLFLLFPTLGIVKQTQDADLQVFYKNPTYDKFLQVTTTLSDYPNKKDLNSLAVIFTMLALQEHPDFALKITQNFAKLKPEHQVLLYTCLVGAGYAEETTKITKQYNYHNPLTVNLKAEQIDKLQLLNQIDNGADLEQQTKIMDFLWVAFFATGNEKYLAKLFDFLTKNETYIQLKWNTTLTTEQLLLKSAIDTTLWSIQSNSCNDPKIKEIILNLAKKNALKDLARAIATTPCQTN